LTAEVSSPLLLRFVLKILQMLPPIVFGVSCHQTLASSEGTSSSIPLIYVEDKKCVCDQEKKKEEVAKERKEGGPREIS
jgi:hypothetical protein